MSKIAIIRVRGGFGVKTEIKDTLDMLNLQKVNHCVVLESNPVLLGMIKKAKDYITWGEINDETLKLLKPKIKGKVARLSPPKQGFGRKGVKMPFVLRGALGNRKEKINDLIVRMI